MITGMGIVAAVVLSLTLEPVTTAPQGDAQTVEVKADVAAVAAGGNAFGCELYGRLREQKGNLFCSPVSIHTALAMTYAGARGQTAEQMAGVLHFELPGERLHAAFAGLTKELNSPPKIDEQDAYRLVVSNALWMQKGFPFKEEFTSLVAAHYGAGLNQVDYVKFEEARKTINAWVEKATEEKIKDLIPVGVLDANTRLVLTNAIYFKSDWAHPFDKAATREEDFLLADGGSVKVPLMREDMHVGYMETEEFQLVDLPYKGDVLSMTVLLPRKADGLEGLEKKLSAEALAEWIAKAQVTYVDVRVPKFKFTSEFGLSKQLVAMGMSDACDGELADFSGMVAPEKGRLCISAVLHKAFVAVDEQGTEAAAATAVIMGDTAVHQPPTVVFRADRPFVFLIRHRASGAILFLGRVANPAE